MVAEKEDFVGKKMRNMEGMREAVRIGDLTYLFIICCTSLSAVYSWTFVDRPHC